MLQNIDHVAIAVHKLDDALPIWRDRLGFSFEGTEVVEDQKVKVAILTKGPHRVELMEPTAEDSPIAGFLAKRGPGLHHICLGVTEIDGMLDDLSKAGLRLINEQPVAGAHGKRVAFIHPKATGGVLLELSADPESAS